MAKDSGNAQGVGGVNKSLPVGAGQKSGQDFLGIDKRISGGTTGSRPDMSARYGGDGNKGTFFVGPSVAKDDKQLNSGGGTKPSAGSGQYGAGSPGFASGGFGSRENMPKYGGETNKGKLVGAGAGATKDSNSNEQYKRDLPAQAGVDVVAGTNQDRKEYARDKAGIGKPGKMGARQ